MGGRGPEAQLGNAGHVPRRVNDGVEVRCGSDAQLGQGGGRHRRGRRRQRRMQGGEHGREHLRSRGGLEGRHHGAGRRHIRCTRGGVGNGMKANRVAATRGGVGRGNSTGEGQHPVHWWAHARKISAESKAARSWIGWPRALTRNLAVYLTRHQRRRAAWPRNGAGLSSTAFGPKWFRLVFHLAVGSRVSSWVLLPFRPCGCWPRVSLAWHSAYTLF